MDRYAYLGAEFSKDCEPDKHEKKVTEEGKAQIRKFHPTSVDRRFDTRIETNILKSVIIPL